MSMGNFILGYPELAAKRAVRALVVLTLITPGVGGQLVSSEMAAQDRARISKLEQVVYEERPERIYKITSSLEAVTAALASERASRMEADKLVKSELRSEAFSWIIGICVVLLGSLLLIAWKLATRYTADAERNTHNMERLFNRFEMMNGKDA